MFFLFRRNFMKFIYLFLFTILFVYSDIQNQAWKEYFPHQAKASSYKQIDWMQYKENYHPNFAFDNDKNTAWVSGESSKQFITPAFSIKTSKLRIQIQNGMQKSKSDYEAYSRPKEILLRVKGSDKNKEELLQLEDKLENQEFEINLGDAIYIDEVEFQILKNYLGKNFKETAMTDIKFFYFAAGNNYESSPNTINEWKKKRIEMAKIMKTEKSNPIAAPTFEEIDREEDNQLPISKYSSEIVSIQKKLAKEKNLFPRLVKFQPIDEFKARDFFLQNLASFLNAETINFEESKKKNYITDKRLNHYDKVTVSLFKVLKENEKVKAISFNTKDTIQERGVYIENTSYLLIYDSNQRLEKVFTKNLNSPKNTKEIKIFRYNSKQQLAEIIVCNPIISTDKADNDKYTTSVYKATF